VSVCQGPEVWSAVTWRGGQLRMDATSYTGKGLLEALRAAHAKHGDTE
jgi:hypothetical protein